MQQIHTTPLLFVTAMVPVRLNSDFLVPKFGICENSRNRSNKSALHLSKGYFNTIMNQPQGKGEIIVRVDVESRKKFGSNFCTIWYSYVKIVGSFTLYFKKLKRTYILLLILSRYWYYSVRWTFYHFPS